MDAVFFVALYETPLSGIFPVIVTETVMLSTVQPLKANEVTVPRPVPDRPLPFLSVPFATDDVQLTDRPAVESFTVVVPAVAVTAPPGLTVQVAANAGAAAKPITDAAPAVTTRALPKVLRIALTPFPCHLA